MLSKLLIILIKKNYGIKCCALLMFLPIVWEEEFVGDILKHLKERRFAPALCYSGFFHQKKGWRWIEVGERESRGRKKVGGERERER